MLYAENNCVQKLFCDDEINYLHKLCAATDGDQGTTNCVHDSEAEIISFKITCIGVIVKMCPLFGMC